VTSKTYCLLLWLSIILILPACADEPAKALEGTVTWIYDGDTLEVAPLGKVRMIGIDVPEREDSSRDRYLAGQGIPATAQRRIYLAAKRFNIRHVKGQKVSLRLGSPPRDRHGRLLAYVYLPDGRQLNRVLIEQGLAAVYRRFSFAEKDDFLAAEARARQTGAGMWAGSRPRAQTVP
jgi:micrococcal nuclease